VPVSSRPEAEHRDPLLFHLLGVWQPSERSAAGSQMIFDPSGRLVFRGGLVYFNPAQWTLDRDRRELIITLPETPNEKLDIFHMSVGDGVKSFDRAQKRVTYRFEEGTTALNIAGWMYSKQSQPVASPSTEAEPILK
jgi:hypothetical protein